MEYGTVLGILAVFFGLIGALGFSLKSFSPEPPPRGGVREVKTKESFAEFHRSRRSASNRDREAILAQRRAS
jgi:hypothetical protein